MTKSGTALLRMVSHSHPTPSLEQASATPAVVRPSFYSDESIEKTMKFAEQSVRNNIDRHLDRFLVEIDLTAIRNVFQTFTGDRFAKYFHSDDTAKTSFQGRNGNYSVDILMRNDDGIHMDFIPKITDVFTGLAPNIDLKQYAKGILLIDAYGNDRKIVFKSAQNGVTTSNSGLALRNYAVRLYR